MNYRSIDDLSLCLARSVGRLRGFDVIVGVPRSGLLAANILALHMNAPVTDVEGLLAGRVLAMGRRGREIDLTSRLNVLVLDDSVRTGAAIEQIRERIHFAGLPHRVTFAAVYATDSGCEHVDFALEDLSDPRIFEWNLMHHGFLETSCVDIDGVLCRDPKPEENDDGPRYREFLRNAEPLWTPTVKIGTLVTCRLEKYRAETEAWLATHGVTYRRLVMLNLPDAATRRRLSCHGRFKGDVYGSCFSRLFVESSANQARDIVRIAGKPVFDLETRTMHTPDTLARYLSVKHRTVRKLRRLVGGMSDAPASMDEPSKPLVKAA